LIFVIVVVVLTVVLIAGAIFLFRSVWTDENSQVRKLAQNLLLAIFSIWLVLVGLELFFRFFFAQSDGWNFTLAAENWSDRYWQVNSLGYRDIEWTADRLAGRTKIMVLGDSFVAGHGIEDEANRFSNVLGQLLGPNYAVMNVGMSGADTRKAIENGLGYPHTPDVIVYTFYINDIGDTVVNLGLDPFQVRVPQVPPGLAPLVEESHAFNFFYWRVYRLATREWTASQWDWLLRAYENPEVWQAYESLLLEMDHFAREKELELIVVVFPNLLAIEESLAITSKVAALYRDQGVPVLEVVDLIEGIPPQQLIVNSVDWHANEFLNQLIAEALHLLILENQIKDESLLPGQR
jgi:hypothetical protein